MKIAIVIAAALLVVLTSLSASLFQIGFVRFRRQPRRDTLSAVKKEFRPLVREGGAWVRAQAMEQVEIPSYDGLRLRGLFLPAEQSRGCLILMHGFRSSVYIDFGVACRYYHELGYDVLGVFQRSHGLSEGKYITYGIRERFDCRSWAEYVSRRFGPDRDIFLGGLSMGASTVLMATGLDLPANVRGVIADCGFTSPREEFRHVLKQAHLPQWPFIPIENALARRFAGFGFDDYSTLEAMKTNRLPILFIHGGADNFVPTEMSRKNYEACRAEKELVIVEGAGHGVSYLEDTPRCQQALQDFLARRGTAGNR